MGKNGSFAGKVFGLAVVFVIIMYALGIFYLEDTIVPEKGVEISEWMDEFYICGWISIIIGSIFGGIWYWKGIKFDGTGNLTPWFWGLWIVSFIIAIVIAIAGLLAYVDGGLLAYIFVILASPIIYYVNTLINSAAAVKYIPFLAKKIH